MEFKVDLDSDKLENIIKLPDVFKNKRVELTIKLIEEGEQTLTDSVSNAIGDAAGNILSGLFSKKKESEEGSK
jgi:hypothetical protein